MSSSRWVPGVDDLRGLFQPQQLCGSKWLLKTYKAHNSLFSFKQELSHATIEMYTNIGRIRSAKLVGKDLAEFYM